MQIFIRVNNVLGFSQLTVLKVNENDTIKSIKDKLVQQKGLMIDKRTLYMGGKPLNDNICLKQYNISNGTQLDILGGNNYDDIIYIRMNTDNLFNFLNNIKTKPVINTNKSINVNNNINNNINKTKGNDNINIRIFPINISRDETVRDLKDKIKKVTRIDINRQELRYLNNAALINDKKLSEYNIGKHSSLLLTIIDEMDGECRLIEFGAKEFYYKTGQTRSKISLFIKKIKNIDNITDLLKFKNEHNIYLRAYKVLHDKSIKLLNDIEKRILMAKKKYCTNYDKLKNEISKLYHEQSELWSIIDDIKENIKDIDCDIREYKQENKNKLFIDFIPEYKICPICTFRNEFDVKRCGMCDTKFKVVSMISKSEYSNYLMNKRLDKDILLKQKQENEIKLDSILPQITKLNAQFKPINIRYKKLDDCQDDAYCKIVIEDSIKEIEYIYDNKLNEYIKDYYDWSCDDVLSWLTIACKGHFKDKTKYKRLYNLITKYDIDGSRLHEITELLLETINLDVNDIDILLDQLNIMLDNKHSKCNICIKNKANILQIPCQHSCVCANCYYEDPTRYAKCMFCREKITKVYQIKMAGR